MSKTRAVPDSVSPSKCSLQLLRLQFQKDAIFHVISLYPLSVLSVCGPNGSIYFHSIYYRNWLVSFGGRKRKLYMMEVGWGGVGCGLTSVDQKIDPRGPFWDPAIGRKRKTLRFFFRKINLKNTILEHISKKW